MDDAASPNMRTQTVDLIRNGPISSSTSAIEQVLRSGPQATVSVQRDVEPSPSIVERGQLTPVAGDDLPSASTKAA